MAVDMFLYLDGVTGESIKKGHEKWIEIFSFSNGVSNASGVSLGTGSGTGKADFSSLSVQRSMDTETPGLFLACCNGTHYKTGKLHAQESGGKSVVLFFDCELTECFIDSISWGGAAGGGKPSESLSFSFKTISITCNGQDDQGNLIAGPNTGWDVGGNTSLGG